MLHDLEDRMQSVDVEDLILVDDSQEVGVFIAGYIANKIHKKLNCTVCHISMSDREVWRSQFGPGNKSDMMMFVTCFSKKALLTPHTSITFSEEI